MRETRIANSRMHRLRTLDNLNKKRIYKIYTLDKIIYGLMKKNKSQKDLMVI